MHFAKDAEWVRRSLHDLCQPLTALQCRLSLGMMCVGEDDAAELAELRRMMHDSLTECERMMDLVRVMQLKLDEEEGLQ